MSRTRRGCQAVAVATLLVGAGTAITAPGAAATPSVRWASPSGAASSTCPQTKPCDIGTAINSAPSGSEVVIEPGTYGSPTPLSVTLGDSPTRTGLYIHGQAGKPMPLIDTAGGTDAGVILGNQSRISDLALDYSGTPQDGQGVALIVTSGSADHLNVRADVGNETTACDVTTTLTDSLCTTNASEGGAIEPGSLNDFHLVLRGDTAEATGADGTGLELGGDTAAPQQTVTVTNSVIHGTGADVAELAAFTSSAITVTVIATHSDLATHYPATLPAGDTLHTDSTDITTAPVFVNPTSGNFAERANSPTVNTGTTDPSHDTDLAGNPRALGRAPDMGAYELRQAPVVARPKAPRKTTKSATLTVATNPEGLATTVVLVAVHGHGTRSSSKASAGAGIKPKPNTLTIHGLHKHTKYRIYAVAKNAAGTVKSKAVNVTTKRH